jgi:membrane protein YqaA with SNARE-associated domain
MITVTDIIIILLVNTIGCTIGSITGYFIASWLLDRYESWKNYES